jgi:hypothetical protein
MTRQARELQRLPAKVMRDEACSIRRWVSAHRVISFFQGFLREVGQAPGRGTAARGDKPIYTRAQIAQLYSAHRRGAYKRREAEWARIDADIIAASREGRILGGGLHQWFTLSKYASAHIGRLNVSAPLSKRERVK